MKTEKEIDSDISSLIWNHGLNLKRTDTDKHGYDMLVQYILKIALQKEKSIPSQKHPKKWTGGIRGLKL